MLRENGEHLRPRGHLERREVECRRNGATAERIARADRRRGLPCAARHDVLRALAFAEIASRAQVFEVTPGQVRART